MTKLQQIAELKEKLNKLEEDVKRDEVEYPCVRVGGTGSIYFFNEDKSRIQISCDQGHFGKSSSNDILHLTTPFSGTITYKNGKPVKTEEN